MASTGTATVLKGESSCTVTQTIAADSFIAACAVNNISGAAGGALVEWIEKIPTTSFKIHMSSPVQTNTVIDYKVV
jgi:hypothetical protein